MTAAAETKSAEMREKARLGWEKRRAGATGPEPHPLFPLYEDERLPAEIAWINLVRYEDARGPVDCPRTHPASELPDEATILQLYGGGIYEIRGRERAPSGGAGRIIKVRRVTLDGPSKPFSGQLSIAATGTGPGPAAGSPAAMDPFALSLAMMQENAREARAAEERRMAREEQRTQQQTAMLMTGVQAVVGLVGSIVTAILTRPQPAPVPPPDPAAMMAAAATMAQTQVQTLLSVMPKPDSSDPLEKLARVVEVADRIKGGTGKGESLGEFMEGLGNAAQGFAAVEHARMEAAKAGLTAPPVPGSMPPPAANGNAGGAVGLPVDGAVESEAGALAS
jgi:hypothetical protein